MFNLDNNQIVQAGYYLNRQLQKMLPGILEERMPMLWGANGQVIPTSFDLTMGDAEVVKETLKEKGREAEFYSEDTEDISLVDVSIGEDVYKALPFVKAYRYTVFQLHRDRKAGRSINELKAKTANRLMQEKSHRFALFGSARHNMTGLYNDANVVVSTSGYDPNTSTAQDDLDFLRGEIEKVRKSSFLTVGIDRIIIPNSLLMSYSTKLIPGTSDSVLSFMERSFIQGNGRNIRFVSANEAQNDVLLENGVNTGGLDRLIFMPDQSDVLELHTSLMDTMPPQLTGLDYIVYFMQNQTQLLVHHPLDMIYSDITPIV